MRNYLVPELAAIADGFPKLDLADLASTREFIRLAAAHRPAYDSNRTLSVTDVAIPGYHGEPDVAGRVYARVDAREAVPGLIYLFGGVYVAGSIHTIDYDSRLLADQAGIAVVALVDVPVWQPRNSPYSWGHYLRGTAQPGQADVPLYAAPGRATIDDVADLPPAFVTSYQVDPTRDEGLHYALTLIQAAVPTDLHHYAGALHVAHSVVPATTIGARMITDRLEAIRRLLVNPQ